eukprot:jgi/Galph1/2318/GphlegSOOS_G1010.1
MTLDHTFPSGFRTNEVSFGNGAICSNYDTHVTKLDVQSSLKTENGESACAGNPKVLQGVDSGGLPLRQFSILRGSVWQAHIGSSFDKSGEGSLPIAVSGIEGRKKLKDPRSGVFHTKSGSQVIYLEEYEKDEFDGDVDEKFGKYGRLYNVEIHYFKGRHSGLASVQYRSMKDALWVAKIMDKKVLMGKEIRVQCDPDRELFKKAMTELESRNKIQKPMVSPSIESEQTLDIETSFSEKQGKKQTEEDLVSTSSHLSVKEGSRTTAHYRSTSRSFRTSHEQSIAPALKLAMLPVSIQETDVRTFFRKVRLFKVLQDGPYWIAVFLREKDRFHVLRKLARDPYQNARILGLRFHFDKYNYALTPQEKKEYDEQCETIDFDEKHALASRSQVIRDAVRSLRSLLLERILQKIDKSVIDETVGRVLWETRSQFLSKPASNTSMDANSFLNEIPSARYDAALLDYEALLRQQSKALSEEKQEKQAATKRPRNVVNTVDAIQTTKRAQTENSTGMVDDDVKSLSSTELASLDNHSKFTAPTLSGYSSSEDDMIGTDEYLVENPNGCVRAEPFVCDTRVNTDSRFKPKFGRTIKNASNFQSSSARENRQEYRRIRQGVGELGIRSSDSLTVSQLKSRKKRVRFGRSTIHGWGLYSMEDIEPNEFIIEYVGEIIRQKISDEREKKYIRQGMGDSYMFRLDEEQVIDATRKGSVARFVNHSCEPNAIAKIITIDNEKKIVFYSKRFIKAGEEITYDYKFNTEDDNNKILCLCGAPNCRKYLN